MLWAAMHTTVDTVYPELRELSAPNVFLWDVVWCAQDKFHNLQGLVQNENVAPLVQKMIKSFSMETAEVKASKGPFWV